MRPHRRRARGPACRSDRPAEPRRHGPLGVAALDGRPHLPRQVSQRLGVLALEAARAPLQPGDGRVVCVDGAEGDLGGGEGAGVGEGVGDGLAVGEDDGVRVGVGAQ